MGHLKLVQIFILAETVAGACSCLGSRNTGAQPKKRVLGVGHLKIVPIFDLAKTVARPALCSGPENTGT